jgi:hypothetical protein
MRHQKLWQTCRNCVKDGAFPQRSCEIGKREYIHLRPDPSGKYEIPPLKMNGFERILYVI